MEKGFFHPSRGYWQTTDEPSDEVLKSYPEGTEEVPLKPGPDYERQDGEWVYVAPVPSITDYEDAIQAHVDAAARSKLFRDGVTLASYTASTNAQWAAEAQAFVAWRDQVWAYAYQELVRVQVGGRAQPSVAEFSAELPLISWP
jgi:hypothetical protein